MEYLDSCLSLQNLNALGSMSCQVLLYIFFLISPEDKARMVGEVRPTIIMFNPCPAWLIKEAQAGLQD